MRLNLFLFALVIASGIVSNTCRARVQPHETANAILRSTAGTARATVGGTLDFPANRGGSFGSANTASGRSALPYGVPGAGPLALHRGAIGGPITTRASTLGGPVAFRTGFVGGPITTPLRHR